MQTSIDTLWDPTKILEYLPKKAKIQIFDRNPDPTFIIEMRTKGIRVTPWPNDYNWITNQRYKVWTPQGRIHDKFTVLEEPKEDQNLTFSYFYSIISLKTFTDFLQPSFSDQLVQMIPRSSTILCGVSLVLVVLAIKALIASHGVSSHLIWPFKEWLILDLL